jgi:hypothetical protein
MSCACRTY